MLLSPFFLSSQVEKLESNWIIELKTGFTFQADKIAKINDQPPLDQEIGNAVKFQFTPTVHYSLFEDLWIGGHLGFGFTNYSDRNTNNKGSSENYKIGVQFRYNFLNLIPEIYLHTELGSNYNYFSSRESNPSQLNESNSYLKSYLDIGINFIMSENWTVAIVFKDVLYNYSSTPNFENRNGFGNSNIFKDFITFPYFSVIFNLK